MRAIRLLICAGYWGLLSVLLLTPNPAAVVGLRRIPSLPWGDGGIHFATFTILTLLVYCACWPKQIGWPVFSVLLAYGIAAESLQCLVPSRVVELRDYAENMLGVAAGTGIYWLAQRLIPRRAAAAPEAENGEPP